LLLWETIHTPNYLNKKCSKPKTMTIEQYIKNIDRLYRSGEATELTYRGDMQSLLRSLCPDVDVVHESKTSDKNKPDYTIKDKDGVHIGHIEAKDVGNKDLTGVKKNKEQFDRYKSDYHNLIFTDYTRFLFYEKHDLIKTVEIATIEDGRIVAKPENFLFFKDCILDYTTKIGEIKSPAQLSALMARKARILANVIEVALNEDLKTDKKDTALAAQFEFFLENLINDIKPKQFADVYAQTITYGMFAARYKDPTPDTFDRKEAAELIPKTNPFLRRLFTFISEDKLNISIKQIVTEIAEKIFRATPDLKGILSNYGGKATQMDDPIIHFYEDFLKEYDSKIRKARGVWYTPKPVVNFIVRAVDDLLKTEFGLKKGIGDASKILHPFTVKDDTAEKGFRVEKREVHRVQILDPATGTGTFLAEIVNHIHQKQFKKQQGAWSDYVDDELIPRLNGFELLMASYAIAHLKLDILLQETGYTNKSDNRFRIFLTNSLAKFKDHQISLPFNRPFAIETNEANQLKRDAPVMCVIGNPPYSGESQNKGEWIRTKMEDYKKEPGGVEKLKERNPKWINDDYVKFMRFGQYFIEENNEGILAFINPHGFLDNPTFRGMRWNLLKTYDKIYTIDLHGNSKKKETAPDGSPDINVFDIQQGVSINIFIKTGKKKDKQLAKVFHYDLYGKRNFKYDFLLNNNLKSVPFVKLKNKAPMYFMVQKDFSEEKRYEKGIYLGDLFTRTNVGIVTSRDNFVMDSDKTVLKNRINDFFQLDKNTIQTKYNLKENKSWKIDDVKNKAKQFSEKFITQISYRPFDVKFIYYDSNFIERSRKEIMQHFSIGQNIGLVVAKQCTSDWKYVFISKLIGEFNLTGTAGRYGSGNFFPLYLYPTNDLFNGNGNHDNEITRIPNLNEKITIQLEEKLQLKYVHEKKKGKSSFAPIDVLDYIYAVLHSPTYREKYKEFLKIDFPRVPYPKDVETFWKLVVLGGELRRVHLLESPHLEESDYAAYNQSGDNIITRKMTKNSIGFELTDEKTNTGKIWVNDKQYFENVPLGVWEFYIGGYQPAQKWLKDRHGRKFSYEDVEHYQKIIAALSETARLMQKIDRIEIE